MVTEERLQHWEAFSGDRRGGTGVTTMDINDPDLLLPSVLPFKKTQLTERYPKGQTRGRHWKHLKQIIQAENYYSYPADEPTCTWPFGFIASTSA